MPDEHQQELNQPGARKRSANRRRGRRGGRGRNLRPAQAPAPPDAGPSPAPVEPGPVPEGHLPQAINIEPPRVERTQPEPKSTFKSVSERPRHEQPPSSSLARAADDVRRVVESLEEALEQMEHVLELVELAGEQKLDDEREIENLRRALRRIQQPPRHESRGRPPQFQEPSREREEPRHEESPREQSVREPEQEDERGEEPPPQELDREDEAS
ncbi:MAG: hypothetical protein ACREE6_11665 [Limisphaerales bacterium]